MSVNKMAQYASCAPSAGSNGLELFVRMGRNPFVDAALAASIYFSFVAGRFSFERMGGFDLPAVYVFLTLMILFTVLFATRKSLHLAGRNHHIAFLVILFPPLMASASALWSPQPAEAAIKLGEIYLVSVLTMLALFWFMANPRLLKWVFVWALFTAAIYSGLVLLSAIGSNARGEVAFGGPNVVTRVIFFGVLGAFGLAILHKKQIFLLSIPFFVLAIIAVGSRGGIIGAGGALFAGTFLIIARSIRTTRLKIAFTKSKAKVFLVVVPVAATVFYSIFPVVQHVWDQRVVSLLITQFHGAGREVLYEDYGSLAVENPLIGIGLSGYAGYGGYPHNLFLELALDGGLIFLLYGLLLLITTVYFLLKLYSIGYVCMLGALYMLIVQQVSGDLYDFRYFYLFFVMAYSWRRWMRADSKFAQEEAAREYDYSRTV